MSGGSLDFLYLKVGELADKLKTDRKSYRRAFGTHLEAIAKALHEIEWVDSGDLGEGDDKHAILECINPALMLTTLIKEATLIRDELTLLLNKMKR